MDLCINLNTDKITIYSPTIQVYKVYSTYNNDNSYTDESGGINVKFYVIDRDYDKGTIRLRIERNRNLQMYIDFNNITQVYNIVKTE